MCEYWIRLFAFVSLFIFLLSSIRFITLIAQHLKFMCGTCFVFGVFSSVYRTTTTTTTRTFFSATWFSKVDFVFFSMPNEIIVLFWSNFRNYILRDECNKKYRVRRKQFKKVRDPNISSCNRFRLTFSIRQRSDRILTWPNWMRR